MATTQMKRTRPWRLSGSARKATLVTHVVSAVGWLGVDVVLLVLAVTGLTSDDPVTVSVCYQAMGLFVTPTLLTAGVVSLGSGILLGLGSKYGLLRYWWVATKLALNLVLTTLVLVLLRPRVDQAAALGRQFDLDALGRLSVDLVFPPAVSITALALATVLAVYKPWGRIRRGSADVRWPAPRHRPRWCCAGPAHDRQDCRRRLPLGNPGQHLR